MPQCPLCKRNASVEGGKCSRCGADLALLEAVRELPAQFYNEGLKAHASGDDLQALLKFGAATQMGRLAEPWVVLGKLFRNQNAIEHARACFLEAKNLGANIPDEWLAAAVAEPQAIEPMSPMEIQALDTPLPLVEMPVGRQESEPPIVAVNRAKREISAVTMLIIAALFGVGLVAGWYLRGTPEPVLVTSTGAAPPIPPQASETSTREGVPRSDQVETSANDKRPDDRASTPVPSFAGGPPSRDSHPINEAIAAATTHADENAPTKQPRTVVVKRGETLWYLARMHLGSGNRWPELVARDGNSLKDPAHLAIGTQLVLPQ